MNRRRVRTLSLLGMAGYMTVYWPLALAGVRVDVALALGLFAAFLVALLVALAWSPGTYDRRPKRDDRCWACANHRCHLCTRRGCWCTNPEHGPIDHQWKR